MRSFALPRSLRERLEQLERDVRHVGRRFRGVTPPPLVDLWSTTAKVARLVPSTGDGFRDATVDEVRTETSEAVTLVLREDGDGLRAFRPGQFLTIEVELPDGSRLRRNYSLSSTPAELPRLAVTVKRVANGKVSPHLVAVPVGTRVRISGPHGSFVRPESIDPLTPIVLVGGGSGITPLYSLLRDALASSGPPVALLYANRSLEQTIFRAEIDALAAEHPRRLHVQHLLEHDIVPPERLGLELDAIPFAREGSLFFVCGPQGLRDEVRKALSERGISPGAIFEERYTLDPHAKDEACAGSFVFEAEAFETTVNVERGQTLLDAGVLAGLPLASSCTMGGCGACRIRLVDGGVTMEEPNCLTDEERREGYILACVSRPKTIRGRVRARDERGG